MPRNITYLRVSTLDQDLEKNKSDILHLANEKKLGLVEFVQEKVPAAGVLTKLVTATVPLLQTVMFAGTATVGVGFTVMV